MSLSSLSVMTKVEDNRDPPGLSEENFKLVGVRLAGVTSSEYERYERNFKSYVSYYGSSVMNLWVLSNIGRNFTISRSKLTH